MWTCFASAQSALHTFRVKLFHPRVTRLFSWLSLLFFFKLVFFSHFFPCRIEFDRKRLRVCNSAGVGLQHNPWPGLQQQKQQQQRRRRRRRRQEQRETPLAASMHGSLCAHCAIYSAMLRRVGEWMMMIMMMMMVARWLTLPLQSGVAHLWKAKVFVCFTFQ